VFELDLSRWSKVWLARPWRPRPVPGTGQIELHGVRGYLVPGDLAYLFNLAAAVPPSGAYLEVGSWLGLSALVVANGLLARLNRHATVWCVDTWQGSPEHQALPEVRGDLLFEQFTTNVREAQMDGLVRAVRGESAAVARAWSGPPPDVIFIDGDHSAEACYQDLVSWRPRLARGGRLLGHDAVPGGSVEEALRRYCAEAGVRASVCPLPASHYIWELHADDRPPPPGHRRLV
jgi:predicted O-methyltransferase YrrM